jgi:Membrane-fusion protein
MKDMTKFELMTRKTTAFIAIASLVSLAACKGGSAADADAASAETATVGTENIAVVVSGVLQNGPTVSGNLTPEKEAMIRAQVGGSVLQTYADEGQRVKTGQTLARIEAGGLQDVFLSARAGVTAAANSADVGKP